MIGLRTSVSDPSAAVSRPHFLFKCHLRGVGSPVRTENIRWKILKYLESTKIRPDGRIERRQKYLLELPGISENTGTKVAPTKVGPTKVFGIRYLVFPNPGTKVAPTKVGPRSVHACMVHAWCVHDACVVKRTACATAALEACCQCPGTANL